MWTEEQFQGWKHSPDTRSFFDFLRDRRESLKERWANGETLSDMDHAIAIVYGDILGLNYERDIAPLYEGEIIAE